MRYAAFVLSMVCSLLAVGFCSFTVIEHRKWRELVAARQHTEEDESPKFTWKQQVAVVGGFYRGLQGEVLEVATDEGGRLYLVKVFDEDGDYRAIRARETELGVIPANVSSRADGEPPADLDELKPQSGALYYKSHEGRLYRGNVDTVKPLPPNPSRAGLYAPAPPTVR